ncbi:hypothetical protein CDAR_114651, partial [Caerostris darwini]
CRIYLNSTGFIISPSETIHQQEDHIAGSSQSVKERVNSNPTDQSRSRKGDGGGGHGTLNSKGPVLLSRLSGAHFKEGPANHISISAPERKAFGESPLGRLTDDRDKGASPPTGAAPGVASR